MKKLLVVVDMQNDFVRGALGSEEAEAIVPAVLNKVRESADSGAEYHMIWYDFKPT